MNTFHKRYADAVPFEPYNIPMRLSKTEVEWVTYMRKLKTCARKKDYATEEDAMRVAIYRLSCPNRPESLVPYKCDVCVHWHLTKKDKTKP